MAQEFNAVHARHVEIAENDIGKFVGAVQHLQGTTVVFGDGSHNAADQAHKLAKQTYDVRLVVDHHKRQTIADRFHSTFRRRYTRTP